MHLSHVTLDHFRSYAHLAWSLGPGLTLVLGENASGKSNLLEAIALLATLRSPRAGADGEMIAWSSPAPPVARVQGTAQRGAGPVTVEVAVAARTDAQGRVRPGRSGAPLSSKRVRLNGVAHRSADVVGAITAVLFSAVDLDVIAGAPSARRRLLDTAISQVDREYARALRTYERALTQRNALLKRIAGGRGAADQLAPWDDAVSGAGATIVAGRAAAAHDLQRFAAAYHQRIRETAGSREEALALVYRPALGEAGLPEVPSPEAVRERLRAALEAQRSREIAARSTLTGPHRDDLLVLLGGRLAAAYGSRAQFRTIAVALRLGEADLLRTHTGEQPIVLLDDLFSELDPARRAATAEALSGREQVIVTSADPGTVPEALRAPAATYHLANGTLTAPQRGS